MLAASRQMLIPSAVVLVSSAGVGEHRGVVVDVSDAGGRDDAVGHLVL